jgi:hypothetical protein
MAGEYPQFIDRSMFTLFDAILLLLLERAVAKTHTRQHWQHITRLNPARLLRFDVWAANCLQRW